MSAGDQHDPTTPPEDPAAATAEGEGVDSATASEATVSDEPVTDDATGEESTEEQLTDEQGDSAAEAPEGDAEAATEAEEPKPKRKGVRRNSAKDFEARDAEEEEKSETPEMDWYILKVQSNRENSICDGLRRRVAVAGLDDFFGEILVPTEDVAEFKNGKRRVVKRKLYPGYIVANMVINDETWFVVRETPGIGDFTGAAGKPTPMLPHEVERIIKSARPDEESDEPKPAIPFKVGDRVRIKEGTFENFEGDVDVIDAANGRVTVMISIFGRSTPVELEHWQIEDV